MTAKAVILTGTALELLEAAAAAGRIVSSVVDVPAGSANATGALSRKTRARAPWTAERADMSAIVTDSAR